MSDQPETQACNVTEILTCITNQLEEFANLLDEKEVEWKSICRTDGLEPEILKVMIKIDDSSSFYDRTINTIYEKISVITYRLDDLIYKITGATIKYAESEKTKEETKLIPGNNIMVNIDIIVECWEKMNARMTNLFAILAPFLTNECTIFPTCELEKKEPISEVGKRLYDIALNISLTMYPLRSHKFDFPATELSTNTK